MGGGGEDGGGTEGSKFMLKLVSFAPFVFSIWHASDAWNIHATKFITVLV